VFFNKQERNKKHVRRDSNLLFIYLVDEISRYDV